MIQMFHCYSDWILIHLIEILQPNCLDNQLFLFEFLLQYHKNIRITISISILPLNLCINVFNRVIVIADLCHEVTLFGSFMNGLLGCDLSTIRIY